MKKTFIAFTSSRAPLAGYRIVHEGEPGDTEHAVRVQAEKYIYGQNIDGKTIDAEAANLLVLPMFRVKRNLKLWRIYVAWYNGDGDPAAS